MNYSEQIRIYSLRMKDQKTYNNITTRIKTFYQKIIWREFIIYNVQLSISININSYLLVPGLQIKNKKL